MTSCFELWEIEEVAERAVDECKLDQLILLENTEGLHKIVEWDEGDYPDVFVLAEDNVQTTFFREFVWFFGGRSAGYYLEAHRCPLEEEQ